MRGCLEGPGHLLKGILIRVQGLGLGFWVSIFGLRFSVAALGLGFKGSGFRV